MNVRNVRLSRRQILIGAGAALAGAVTTAANPGRPARASAPPEPVDQLVIGSGFAGAVAAFRLAEAGLTAVVLERGRRWPIRADGDTFATAENLDGRAAWLSTSLPVERFTGVLEAVFGDGIGVFNGAGVGGGSLNHQGVTMQPPERQFRRSFGATVSYHEMAAVWYPRAEALLGASPIPDDVLATDPYRSARDFLAEAGRAGLPTIRPDILVDWSVVRQELAGTRVPGAIAGQSPFGINSGAKLSVDRTLLQQAEQTGRVSVLPLHRVAGIAAYGHRFLVRCEQLNDVGDVVARPAFLARRVFLAAGSTGTSSLLVRAKARGDLPRLNRHVGRHWGSSGDHTTVRIGMGFPPSLGGPAHVGALDRTDPRVPLALLNFLGAPEPVPGEGSSAALATTLVPPLGRFRYLPETDSVRLSWPATDPAVTRITTAVNATLDRLAAANPGTSTFFVSPEMTSHSLGGAVLGAATRTDDGALYGYRRLHVLDSALIPGSAGGVPPALTVAALADRCVTRAIHQIQNRVPDQVPAAHPVGAGVG